MRLDLGKSGEVKIFSSYSPFFSSYSSCSLFLPPLLLPQDLVQTALDGVGGRGSNGRDQGRRRGGRGRRHHGRGELTGEGEEEKRGSGLFGQGEVLTVEKRIEMRMSYFFIKR